jgi:hypothetical protein
VTRSRRARLAIQERFSSLQLAFKDGTVKVYEMILA